MRVLQDVSKYFYWMMSIAISGNKIIYHHFRLLHVCLKGRRIDLANTSNRFCLCADPIGGQRFLYKKDLGRQKFIKIRSYIGAYLTLIINSISYTENTQIR